LVAWSYVNYLDFSGGVVVNFPNDGGWDPGDQVASTGYGYGASPTVGRDRNGDAWVAWSESFQPFRWTHTHNSATTMAPSVDVFDGHPRVTWALSATAPGSWWAVLRRIGAGDFVPVARLQAGADPAMSWVDADNRPGWLRRDDVSYRVRRESVDSRFEWLSPIARLQPGGPKRFKLHQRGFTADALTLDLSDAMGAEVTLTICDVAGRVVHQRRVPREAGSSQPVDVSLQDAGLRPGMYFARFRDQSGRVSESTKFVILR
jgi:hypothetical protein